MSRYYSKEMMDCALDSPVIVEFEDGKVVVGWLQRSHEGSVSHYKVLPLDFIDCVINFSRSSVRKIIYPRSRYVLPKSRKSMGRTLTMSELHSYLDSHGYTVY